jgi:hypothetical protein
MLGVAQDCEGVDVLIQRLAKSSGRDRRETMADDHG